MRIARRAIGAIEPMVNRGDERAILYMDVIQAYLEPTVLERILEEQMSLAYQPISPYFKRSANSASTAPRGAPRA